MLKQVYRMSESFTSALSLSLERIAPCANVRKCGRFPMILFCYNYWDDKSKRKYIFQLDSYSREIALLWSCPDYVSNRTGCFRKLFTIGHSFGGFNALKILNCLTFTSAQHSISMSIKLFLFCWWLHLANGIPMWAALHKIAGWLTDSTVIRPYILYAFHRLHSNFEYM